MDWHSPENLGASFAHMAGTLMNEGNHDEALDLFEKSLAIAIKVHGPDHANVAAAYSNMGVVCFHQSKHGKALMLFQKALDMAVRAQGPTHPFVATLYANMAAVFEAEACTPHLELFFLNSKPQTLNPKS